MTDCPVFHCVCGFILLLIASRRAWAEDSLFDFTMANGQHFFPLRALVHELRFGRYTFARFLADVRARERAIGRRL